MRIAAMAILAALVSAKAGANECAPTARDYLGPFYVANTPVLADLNRFGKSGEPMRLTGQVYSAQPPYGPVPGAKVEIWQTDGTGRYYPQNNGDIADYNDADIDLRGTVYADEQGRFEVMSLVPREYFPRPSHIHYVVSAPGFETLVTQHYLYEGEFASLPPCRSGPVKRDASGVHFQAPDIFLRAEPHS